LKENVKHHKVVRDIAKFPLLPKKSLTSVSRYINNLFFQINNPLPIQIDTLFIFGSPNCYDSLKTCLQEIFKESNFNNIIITGGKPNFTDSVEIDKAESLCILDYIRDIIPPGIELITEENSVSTAENVEFGLKALGSIPKSICFVCKNVHALRAYLTLLKISQHSILYQRSYVPYYFPSVEYLTPDSWVCNLNFQKLIWGEVQRISHYGTKGLIAYPENVKTSIEKILLITK